MTQQVEMSDDKLAPQSGAQESSAGQTFTLESGYLNHGEV